MYTSKLLLPSLFILVSVAISNQDCGKYFYLTQPPSQLPCDPYSSSRVNIECDIAGPNFFLNSSEPEFSVKWFRVRSDSLDQQPEEMRNGLHYPDLSGLDVDSFTIVSSSLSKTLGLTLRSELELFGPTNVSQGVYWCQIALEVDNTYQLLDKSSKVSFEAPPVYESLSSCSREDVFLELSLECAASVLSPAEPQSTTTTSVTESNEMPPTCSSQNGSQGDLVLPMKWIIILGCIGGSLLMTIVILIVFLCVMCARVRKGRPGRDTALSVVAKRPVKQPPPVPDKPVSRCSSTTNIIALDSPVANPSNGSAPTTTTTTSFVTPLPPLFTRGGAVRSSMPSRLQHTAMKDLSNEYDEEEYTPVLSQHDRKANTLIEKLRVACDQRSKDRTSQQQQQSGNSAVPPHEYRGLNPRMMDDIQPYDSTRVHTYESDSDDLLSSDDDGQPEYSEPDAHHTTTVVRNHSDRPQVLSMDGEYVYPNSSDHVHVAAQVRSYKELVPNHKEYMALYATPDS